MEPLSGHNDRHPHSPESLRYSKELSANHVVIAELREERAERIENDKLRVNLPDSPPDLLEEPS